MLRRCLPLLWLAGLAALAGCRELPGRCSGKAERLCVEVIGPGAGAADQPEALLVAAQGGGKEINERIDGVRGPFQDRGRYVFELDLTTIAQAQEVLVQVQATYAGSALVERGAATWRRGGAQPITLHLSPDPSIEMGPAADLRTSDGGNDGGGPRPPLWRQTATGKLGDTFSAPTDVCWTGTRLYVSDRDHHRVLIYTSITPGAKAVGVIGRPDLTPQTTAPTAASGQVLKQPQGLYCEGNLLFVADTGFHRVLIFIVESAAVMGPSTSLVIGQASVDNQQSANRGGAPSARSLSSPQGVFWDRGRVYVADTNNYRVVGYTAGSTADFGGLANLDARTVLGQAEPGKITNPPPTPTDAVMNGPAAVFVKAGRVAIPDVNYSRVLLFNAPPDHVAGNPAPAAYAVFGQPDFMSKKVGLQRNELSAPSAIRELGGQVFISEFLGNRVLIFDRPLPTASEFGPAADAELGANAFEGIKLKQPGGVALAQPGGPETLSLIVPDTGNNRVLIFNPQ